MPDPVDPVRATDIRHVVLEATGIRPTASRLVMWQVLLWISSVLCFAGGLFLNVEHLKNGQGQSILGWLLIEAFLLVAILMANVRRRAYLWIYQKLLRADYKGALDRADLLIRWFPGTPLFHYMRGSVLHYAGRLTESEESFRTGIGKGQRRAGAIQAVALTNFGNVLLHLGRFDAATQALKAVTKTYPRFYDAYNGLAEVLLRQGREAQRALLLVDNALKLRQDSPSMQKLDRHNLANMWANRAQAAALLGQMDDAASCVRMASEAGDPAFIPGLAATAWRCGMAFRLMNQESAALKEFQKATELDPKGFYGKLGASAVREHSVHR